MDLRIPTDPSKSIKVIGAGQSRTGSVSFSMALEKLLRGPVCHSGSACLLREEGNPSLISPSTESRKMKSLCRSFNSL